MCDLPLSLLFSPSLSHSYHHHLHVKDALANIKANLLHPDASLQTGALDYDQEDWEASSCRYLQYKKLTFYKLQACLHVNKSPGLMAYRQLSFIMFPLIDFMPQSGILSAFMALLRTFGTDAGHLSLLPRH